MAKCAACGKFLKPSIGAASCSKCPCIYHKGCVAIPDGASMPTDWVCPECKKKHRKGDNSDTPVKGVCGVNTSPPPVRVTTTLSPEPIQTVSSISFVGNPDVPDWRHELSEYMAEQREFRNELRASIASLGQRMDGFERRLQTIEQRGEPVGMEDVTNLQQVVAELKREINDRDQDTLLSDLDIGHIPEESGENVCHTVTILAAKLGVTIENRDIVFAERVGLIRDSSKAGEAMSAERRPRRVVVRLARRDLRDEILRAARVRRTFTTGDVGLAGSPRRVYINERLTKINRQLFQHVREECRKQKWRYSWTKRGRIFVRHGDGTQVYQIRSDADISRVFRPGSV